MRSLCTIINVAMENNTTFIENKQNNGYLRKIRVW